MLAHHKACLLALASTSALFAFTASTSAAPFDTRKCSAIQKVDVPYDVTVAGDRIAFSGSSERIVVAPSYVELDGRRFADAALSPAYYRDVRGFLHSATALPKTAAEFGKTAFLPGPSQVRRNFLGGVTAMCRSILTLADDNKRMRATFGEFISPVEITLSD